MVEIVSEIISILKSKRLPLTTEKELQVEIEKLFIENNLSFEREYRLDNKNIVDFFIEGVAVEIKIKGTAKNIYKQCERYCEFEQVKTMLLVTSKTMGFLEQINDKDCYYFSLSRNWL